MKNIFFLLILFFGSITSLHAELETWTLSDVYKSRMWRIISIKNTQYQNIVQLKRIRNILIYKEDYDPTIVKRLDYKYCEDYTYKVKTNTPEYKLVTQFRNKFEKNGVIPFPDVFSTKIPIKPGFENFMREMLGIPQVDYQEKKQKKPILVLQIPQKYTDKNKKHLWKLKKFNIKSQINIEFERVKEINVDKYSITLMGNLNKFKWNVYNDSKTKTVKLIKKFYKKTHSNKKYSGPLYLYSTRKPKINKEDVTKFILDYLNLDDRFFIKEKNKNKRRGGPKDIKPIADPYTYDDSHYSRDPGASGSGDDWDLEDTSSGWSKKHDDYSYSRFCHHRGHAIDPGDPYCHADCPDDN